MNTFCVLLLCLQYLAFTQTVHGSLSSIIDKGDHVLMCSQEPIEFGIVLDSSVSIAEEDFEKGKEFLAKFLSQFDIGDGVYDVRVSIITFGLGIYPQDAFYLDTYKTKDEVLNAIMDIPHRAGPRTDTGLAIQFMHNKQLSTSQVRSNAEKICLVITDGNSQSWTTTKREAAKARADNITMFALGVGDQIREQELYRIAGSMDRVTVVSNFDSLDSIREILAKKTCIRKEKPTTTPPPMIQSCGEANPSDIEFIFSPSDLGMDATAWTTSFISNMLDSEDMEIGIRYGVNSGSCPDASGFDLDRYDSVHDIHARLDAYDRMKLPSLITADVFDESRGGRSDARDIAVIFVNEKGAHELKDKIQELDDRGVKVYIANPAGYPVHIEGSVALSGRSSRQQSEFLLNLLCPET